MRPLKIGAAVLAAGFSRRLGRPKQDLVLQGETLLHRAIHTVHTAGLAPIILVVRDPGVHLAPTTPAVTPLLNPRAAQGMGTSVVLAAQHAQQLLLDGLVLLTCDQPALQAAHLRALIADPARVTGSRYSGRTGVPAYFPATFFPALQQLQGDAGARSLLAQAAFVTDESLALDIDTEADYLDAQRRLATSP